jgi:hypothetical protein
MSKHISNGGGTFYKFDPTDPPSLWPPGVIRDSVTGKYWYMEIHNNEPYRTIIHADEGLLPIGPGKAVVLEAHEVKEISKDTADINAFLEMGVRIYNEVAYYHGIEPMVFRPI